MAQAYATQLPTVSQLLSRNREYAKTHKPFPNLSEIPPATPKPRVIIYCCLDNRVRPEDFLGLKPGEVFIIRNAASSVARNLPDLLALDQLIGGFDEILVIEHTDCGGTHVTTDGLRQGLRSYVQGHDEEIDAVNFEPFQDPEERARYYVDFVKNHPLIRKELAAKTTGAVYDIKTGLLTTVDA